MIKGIRTGLPHLSVWDGAGEPEETVSRILERRVARTHLGEELAKGDSVVEVDCVPNKVGRVDFGTVDLDYRPIFCKLFLPNAETNRGRS